MTDRQEAYGAFIEAFTVGDDEIYPGRTKAVREGAALIRSLVEEQSDLPPRYALLK